MKWIKSRKSFLSEAKIGEVILPRQAKQVKSEWGELYLQQEEIIPTDKIKQGTWKLSEEDKNLVLGKFFGVNMNGLYKIFKNLPEKFHDVLSKSLNIDSLPSDILDKFITVIENFNLKDPSIDEIYLLYENIFRKLSVGETKSTEAIKRDENGRPIMGEDGKPIKIQKESGDPIFSNNLVNIVSFISDFNNCYPDDAIDSYPFTSGVIFNIRNTAGEDMSGGEYQINFDIFKRDLYLQILHKPKDILNMSISKFFASCQHLYTGGWKELVISNVFDPNSIPAFLKFDTPIYWEGEKISEQLPIARMQIRNIEGYNSESTQVKIFFDRCYPDRMEEIMEKMVEKYSENYENTNSRSTYLFTPDIDPSLYLRDPYMDRLSLERGKYIGVNATAYPHANKIHITQGEDWSKVLISPKSAVKELIIENNVLPPNIFDLALDLNWVKFKFLKINSLSMFKFKTNAYGFDKCFFGENIISDIKNSNPEISKLSFYSCEISNLNLNVFEDIEELELCYTLETEDKLSDIIGDLKIKKLTISSDVLSNEENKSFILELKRKGTKVKIVGLKI